MVNRSVLSDQNFNRYRVFSVFLGVVYHLRGHMMVAENERISGVIVIFYLYQEYGQK